MRCDSEARRNHGNPHASTKTETGNNKRPSYLDDGERENVLLHVIGPRKELTLAQVEDGEESIAAGATQHLLRHVRLQRRHVVFVLFKLQNRGEHKAEGGDDGKGGGG